MLPLRVYFVLLDYVIMKLSLSVIATQNRKNPQQAHARGREGGGGDWLSGKEASVDHFLKQDLSRNLVQKHL